MFIPTIGKAVPLTYVPGVIYGTVDGIELPMDLVLPQETSPRPRPAVVWLFGGGWFSGSRGGGLAYWCPLLAAHGIVAAAVDYRLSGDATFPAQIHDVKAAIRWLRAQGAAYGIDPDRIGIMGHSAGGHLAALAALSGHLPELEGVCGNAGVSSSVRAAAVASANTDFLNPDGDDANPAIIQLFGGTDAERAERMRMASPVTHVKPGAPPFLIAHGTLDETVPFNQARRLLEALQDVGATVEFVPIEGAYHNWNHRPDSTWPKVRYFEFAQMALQFFRDHL